MICTVCNNESARFWCASCVKTSPALAMRLRLQLLAAQEQNRRLGRDIESILSAAMDSGNAVDTDTDKENLPHAAELPPKHTAMQEVLRARMTKVNDYKHKKEEARIKIRTDAVSDTVDAKRQEVAQLKLELQQLSHLNKANATTPAANPRDSPEYKEAQWQVDQIQPVLSRQRTQQLQQLYKWFLIGKTTSANIRYVIAFQPMVSIRIAGQLPTSIVHNSLYTMRQYLDLLAVALAVPPESLHGGSDLKQSLLLPVSQIKTQIPVWLAQIALDTVTLCQHSGTLPRDTPTDTGQLLTTHDVDGVLYALASGQKLAATAATTPSPPPLSLQDIAAFIADRQSTSPPP